jgi:integrase/recombinase XerC/integrase/recombinase XerD
MDSASVPLQIIAEHYIATCRTEGKTPKTLASYKEKLDRFVRWLGGTTGDLSIEAVREYIAALQVAEKWEGHPYTPTRGTRLSATSVANHVRVLKGFATWLNEESITPDNILRRLSIPRAPRKLAQILDDQEIERLLSSANADTPLGCRDLTIVALLLDTGLRRSELVSLTIADVHLEEQWLKVFGKGQKERIVPFGSQAGRLLARYLTLHRPATTRKELFLCENGDPISQNTIAMLFARLRRRSGIARLHPHLLRHTFATSFLVAGGDVFTLQNILGHTTLEMTRRYVTLASSHVTIQHQRFSPLDRLAGSALRNGRSDRRMKRASHASTNTVADGRAKVALLTAQPSGAVRIVGTQRP